MQAALARAREGHKFQELDVRARELPRGDVRREAWLTVNRYNATWVTAWPSADLWVLEITTCYFGLPSPALCAA
eukprot:10433997-Karenia_brevis.AAC.1